MNINKLLELNVNDKTDKKNNLTYLSWAWAWAEFIKVYPESTYKIHKNEDSIPVFGNEHMGYMVYTSVTVEDITHEMWLPVMDYRNKAIKNPDMFDINKTVMRCLTKNLAMFGLGLYIYAGEDLPEQKELSDEEKEKIAKDNEQREFLKNFRKALLAQIKDLIVNKIDNFDNVVRLSKSLNKHLGFTISNLKEIEPKLTLITDMDKLQAYSDHLFEIYEKNTGGNND